MHITTQTYSIYSYVCKWIEARKPLRSWHSWKRRQINLWKKKNRQMKKKPNLIQHFLLLFFFFLVFHIDKLFILDLLAMNLSLIVPYWSMTFIIVINLRIRTDFPLHLHLFIYCSSHASIRDSCCHHTRENSKNSIDQWNGFSSNSVICFPTLSKYWWTVIAAKARTKKKHTTIFQLFILNDKWMICRN